MPCHRQCFNLSRHIEKFLIIITLPLFLNSVLGQNQCSCESNKNLSEAISCKPVIFVNKAKLYTHFNCDSSWMTFESKNGKKAVIFGLGDNLIELTGRLGYIYATEYQTRFLIQNNVISRC